MPEQVEHGSRSALWAKVAKNIRERELKRDGVIPETEDDVRVWEGQHGHSPIAAKIARDKEGLHRTQHFDEARSRG